MITWAFSLVSPTSAWLLLGNILHFCLLWLSGDSPLNCYILFVCSPSNVNQDLQHAVRASHVVTGYIGQAVRESMLRAALRGFAWKGGGSAPVAVKGASTHGTEAKRTYMTQVHTCALSGYWGQHRFILFFLNNSRTPGPGSVEGYVAMSKTTLSRLT